MKFKIGFVTNSSSTGFIIYNNTDKLLTIADFVVENPQLIEEFVDQYNVDETEYTQEKLIHSAIMLMRNEDKSEWLLKPGANPVVFGDEQGTLIGKVFDYILRDSGSSERFSWKFDQYYR
jgi:hypothetical protein